MSKVKKKIELFLEFGRKFGGNKEFAPQWTKNLIQDNESSTYQRSR